MATILTASTEAQLNADIAEVNSASAGSAFVIEFTADVSLTANITPLYSPAGSVTLTIDGEGYALEDAGGYNGFVNYNPPSSLTFENLIIANVGVLPPTSSSGSETIGTTQTINQTADILLAGTINNEGIYDIDQATSGATGGANGETYGPTIYDSGTAGSFINEGTLEKTGESGVDEIFVNVTDTGTISVTDPNSNLRFDGASNSFSGTFIGGGMIDYGDPLTPGYGTEALGNVDMSQGACTTTWAVVNQKRHCERLRWHHDHQPRNLEFHF